MRLGFQHLRNVMQDITTTDGSDPLDLFISHEMFTDRTRALTVCLRDGCDLSAKLALIQDGIACIQKHGVAPDLCAYIATSVGLPVEGLSQESLWDGMKTVYLAIKEFLLDLWRRFKDWITSLWRKQVDGTSYSHSKLAQLCTNYSPTAHTITLKPVKNIDAFNAYTTRTYSAAELGTSMGVLAALNEAALNFGTIHTYDSIFDYIEVSRFFGDYFNKETGINSVIQMLEPMAHDTSLMASGWTPQFAVDFMKVLINEAGTFKQNAFINGGGSPSICKLPEYINKLNARVCGPQFNDLVRQCEVLASAHTSTDPKDKNPTAETLEEGKRNIIKAVSFINTVGSLYSVLFSYAIEMVNQIEVEG